VEKFKKYPAYMKGRKLAYPEAAPFSPIFANAVRAGDLLFIAGQTAIDPETGFCLTRDMHEQMYAVMTRIQEALEEAGSDMEHLASMTIILADMRDYFVMRQAEQDFYRDHCPSLLESPPASTVFSPAEMARREFMVEVSAVGYIPEGK